MSIKDSSAKDYANIEQREFEDEKSQKWIAVKQTNGRIVFLSALDTNYCIDLQSANAANESNIQLYSKNNTLAQQWKILKYNAMQELADQNQGVISDGEYRIKSAVNSKYVMDVQWASKDNGANIWTYENNGTAAQIWEICHDDNHYVILKNKESGKTLSVKDNSAKNYVNIEQREFKDEKSQKWIAVKQTNDKTTFISALNENYCIDLESANATNESNIQLYSKNGTAAQQWGVEKADPVFEKAEENKNTVANGEYRIKSAVNPKYAIDVRWASSDDGANIQLYEENGTFAQSWIISHDIDNFVILKNKSSGKVLSVKDSFLKNETNIEQRSYKEDDRAQKWIAVKQLDGNIVFISALNTNYCIDLEWGIAGNERNIQLYNVNGSDAQEWKFVR